TGRARRRSAPPGGASRARARRPWPPPPPRVRAPRWIARARRPSDRSLYLSPLPSPQSFYCSNPPFTRSSPTGSPRVLRVGWAVRVAGARCRRPAPQLRISQLPVAEGKSKAYHAAAVHPGLDLLRRHTGPAAHLREAALLDWVFGPRIDRDGPAVMARECEHAGVLSGAVRVDRGEPHAPRLVILRHALGERRMWTAQQVAL